LKAALESDLRNFGENHPKVANRCNNLGTLYFAMGDLKSGLSYFQVSYKIFHQWLGESHPHTKQVEQSIMIVREKIRSTESKGFLRKGYRTFKQWIKRIVGQK